MRINKPRRVIDAKLDNEIPIESVTSNHIILLESESGVYKAHSVGKSSFAFLSLLDSDYGAVGVHDSLHELIRCAMKLGGKIFVFEEGDLASLGEYLVKRAPKYVDLKY